MDFGHVLFRLNGRIGKQDFWIGVLIIVGGNVLMGLTGPLAPFLWLALLWVGVAVYGKRLHDAGRTAWYHAFVWALSLVLGGIGTVVMAGTAISAGILSDGADLSVEQVLTMLSVGGVGLLIFGLSNLVWIIYTIWVGLMPGDPGDNAYGPPPTGDAATSATASAAAASTGAPLAGEVSGTARSAGDAPGDGGDAPKS